MTSASGRATDGTATIVGGGPAGLIAAEVLGTAGVAVTVYDRMPSVGRKFLRAGHGGLNLTHSEEREPFLSRYTDSADLLAPILRTFSPQDLRDWSAGLGEPTFIGSSGRVFPRSFRAVPLVRAWLARLDHLGVNIQTRHRWEGWEPDGSLIFARPDATTTTVSGDVTVFALGGASWPTLGSDGRWVDVFRGQGFEVAALRAANVGIHVDWTPTFSERFAGTPLKNVGIRIQGSDTAPVRGDGIVTAAGLEGGPVYAIGRAIRGALDAGECVLHLDLRPDVSVDQLTERLAKRRPKDSRSTWLRRSGLDPVSIALLWEATGGTFPTEARDIAALIKTLPITVTSTMPIERAISTAGGLTWSNVDESLMLRSMPGTFIAGEMLDWEAPTGGYLLQASFSTGVAAAYGALDWLRSR